jgi:hypothetical protein
LSLAPVHLFGPDLLKTLSLWSYFTGADLTNGIVDYVSEATASSQGMVYVHNGAAVLSVNNKTDLPLNTPRQSCVVSANSVEVPHD